MNKNNHKIDMSEKKFKYHHMSKNAVVAKKKKISSTHVYTLRNGCFWRIVVLILF